MRETNSIEEVPMDGGSDKAKAKASKPRSARKATSAPSDSGRFRSHLRSFVHENQGNWDHDGWLGLLRQLEESGHDLADPDAIGAALERERLDWSLAKIRGLDEGLRATLVDRYGRIWELERASSHELQGIPGMTADLVRQVNAAGTEFPHAP